MARAPARSEPAPAEADAIKGVPSPREHGRFIGHAATERTVLEALSAGTLHHALILGGPQGIGKATFAYRLARFLLAGGDPRSGSLATPDGAPAARLVGGGAHPDLQTLMRARNRAG